MANKRSFPLQLAELRAKKLVRDFGLQQPEHIDLAGIADCHGAKLVEGGLKNAAARLCRTPSGAIIRVSESINNRHHKKFSIGHELGHLVLNHKQGETLVCTDSDMLKWSEWEGNSSDYIVEAQANVFSAELLMPETMVKPYCEVSPVNFEKVNVISELFDVSRTAAAIRFVRFASEKCAVVYSDDGKVKWCYRSPDFHYFIPSGKELHNSSLAVDFFRKGKLLHPEPEDVPGYAWFNSSDDVEVVEHTFASPRLGFTLTLLWEPQ